MTKANRKHFGPATKGKGDGSGGTTDLQEGLVGENVVLTNRDKSQHGADSKWVETEQLRDHAANREPDCSGLTALRAAGAEAEDTRASACWSGKRSRAEVASWRASPSRKSKRISSTPNDFAAVTL